jgi:dienelactone hydrolase
MFEGDPAPFDLATPGFNATEWTLTHNPTVITPILNKAIAYIQSKGITKIAATGYCFGGRYSFRLLAAGTGVTAAFSAHPSLLEDSEILAITGPISVAAAGEFYFFFPAQQDAIC